MGLDKRDKVHEIEFLALLAFIARERQRLTREVIPRSHFTHNDLAMAYAFQHRFGPPPPGGLLTPFQQSSVRQLDQSFPPPNIMVQRSTSDSPLAHYQPTAIMGMIGGGDGHGGVGVGGDSVYPPIPHTFSSSVQQSHASPANRGSLEFSSTMKQPPQGQTPERFQQSWCDSG